MKILVVNVNWIGDVVFTSTIFHSLKESYPEAQISCMAVPRVHEILRHITSIDDIINFDEEKKHKSILGKIKLIFQLRKEKFDIVFLLHRSFTRSLLVFLARIPVRVGYDHRNRKIFLTHIVKPLEKTVHRAEHYLHVIESYGVKVKIRESSILIDEQLRDDAKAILRQHGVSDDDYIVIVHPGANWELKKWPQHNFTLLIEQLILDLKLNVVMTGAPSDMGHVQDIVKGLKKQPIILVGKTDLKQLVALLKRANIVISADSGPLHLANSCGTDVIGIYGPTRPEITGPRGAGRHTILQKDVGCNRVACYYLECPDNVCMQAITVQDVIESVKQIKDS